MAKREEQEILENIERLETDLLKLTPSVDIDCVTRQSCCGIDYTWVVHGFQR